MNRAVDDFDDTIVHVPTGGVTLEGNLTIPVQSIGIVLFAHGSGSSRHSRRNRQVAKALQDAQMGTLLIDLLSAEEEAIDQHTAHIRFDIGLLADRLGDAIAWLRQQSATRDLPVGLFGASTGGGAALVAAAARPADVAAVVSRGGRPDLAGAALQHVRAPTLLIGGSLDRPVIAMNQSALQQMSAQVRLEIVPGASHLFEEPGKLEEVSRLARDWFTQHFSAPR
jgi:putative phosphoribosyl transferase